MLHNSRHVMCGNPPALDHNIFPHVDVVLPRKTDFTLKMLCMHHIIPNQYIHPSGGSYSWLFAPDHGGNRTTKLCLGTYLTPLVMTVRKTSKSYTLRVAYNTSGSRPRTHHEHHAFIIRVSHCFRSQDLAPSSLKVRV